MFYLVIYLILILAELVFIVSFLIFTLSLFFSSLKGAPYVPTKSKEADIILKEAHLKKDQYFIELGCGDGRVVRHAVSDYQAKGLGIDVNPLLICLARFYANFKKLQNIQFKIINVLNPALVNEIKTADVIYMFFMPKLLETLCPILKKHCRKNTMIISHGFQIEQFSGSLIKKLDCKPFPTYFYKL